MLKMLYQFIDNFGTFRVKDPQKYNLYFPLTNRCGSILSSISPNLAGDIKKDNEHFLTPPASIEDLRSNFLCRRDFFILTGKQVIRASLPYNDLLEIGFLYHKVTKNTGSLVIEIVNFIPYDSDLEVMSVRVRNISSGSVKISPVSFIPLYGRSEKNLRDHRHVSSLLNRIEIDKYGISLKPTMIFDEKQHKINEDIYFVFGFEGNFKAPLGQYPTLDYFCGQSDMFFPDAVMKNKKPLTKKSPDLDGKEACASFRFKDKVLRLGESVDYYLLMGIGRNKALIKKGILALNSRRKIENALQETKKYWRDYLSEVEFKFGDEVLDNWLRWVKFQPTLRKLFGCSFLPHFDYGKGGRGWRDLWQDALTLLLTEPGRARRFILNNFKGVRLDGSNATIIGKEGNFVSDRNRIARVWMDHGIWPYLTLRSYLNRTGDLNILLEDAEYFRDAQLRRAKEFNPDLAQEDNILRDKTGKIYRGTILEHILIENLAQFFNVGKHNVVRLENADWNDGLDMAAKNGESVAFSFMYAHNLKDICLVLEKLREKSDTVYLLKELDILLDRLAKPINYNDYRQKQKRLDAYFNNTESIKGQRKKIKIDELIFDLNSKAEHMFSWLKTKEWLADGFFNGYYDNDAKRVEGKYAGKLRMTLTAQVFALMSGVASKDQIEKVWLSLNKNLRDKQMGGFRLNTDFKGPCLNLGRAFGFSYGDKENGAFFSHMAIMLANALYKRDFNREGFEVLDSIYKMAISEKSQIYPFLPEYFNNQGKGLYYYLTGSASWLIFTLVEEVFGVKFIFGDLLLEPKFTRSNFHGKQIEITFNLEGKTLHVIFVRRTELRSKPAVKEVYLDKEIISLIDGRCIIERERILQSDKKEIEIKVML